jgi:hypothetical protein
MADPPPQDSQNISEKQNRKFWQFHLSTAVLMSIMVGCLIPLNWKPLVPLVSDGSH